MAAAITRGPALAPEREGRAPTWLKATLVRGLAGDPVDRWPSMDALLSALLDDPQARRRRWVIAGGLVLGVGALVGALASSSLEGRRQAEVATRRAEVASAERDVALETAEQAATRARDALRMSALREVEVDSTSAALVLAEVEAPARAPGWTEAALALRQEPIAQVVLRGHGNWIVGALFIGDGEEWVVTSSYDATARVWRADGRGGAQVLWHAGLVELLPGADRRSFITNDKRVARLWSLTDRPGEPVELVREFAADDGAELVALTPDGARLFTISAEGVGRLWEVATGRALVVYGADGGAQPVAVAYDPAGRWITGDVHGRLRSWSVDDERHGAVPTPGGALINLHVGVHGQIIAAYEQEAIAWSSSGERRFVASGHESGLFDAVINPAGDELATAGHDGVVRLWGVERGELRAALEHTSTLSGVTYSPDGRWIGVNTYDSTLLWSRASPHELHELRGRIGQGAGMVMDQAGARVLTFADDNTARLWTLTTTPTMLFRLRALEEAFGGCELGRVVAVSSAGTLRAWACDASTPPIEQALGGQAFFFAPDPTLRLAAYTNSEGVWVRPLAGGAARRLGTHEPLPWGLAWSPDGRWLLTTGYDSVARIWDVTGDAPPIVLAGHTAPVVWGGAFSPDGQAVATIGNDASVRIWSVGHVLEAPRAGELTIAAAQVHAGHVRGAKQVRWSPDGSRVLTCSPDATARIWDPTGAVAPVVLEGHRGEVSAAEWSPDGRMVATASEDGTARLWSLDAVDAPRVLRGHRDAVASIDWHPDGGAVVTASADGTVRVWTVADGATVDVLNLRAEVLAAEFVDGGARVRIAGDDALRLWRPQLDGRPEPDALMGRLRASTTACLTVRERELILLESLEEARARHAACEARFGRAPDEREGVAQRPPAPAG
ncbi:MAG: WD40 repeat domain-containing protein [Nannocystaceae bacterium]